MINPFDAGAYWLPLRFARFHAEHPEIEIRLSLGNTDQVTKPDLESKPSSSTRS